MRVFVDLDPATMDRATEALRLGGYRSLGEFLAVAVENQISHELAVDPAPAPDSTPRIQLREEENDITPGPEDPVFASAAPAALASPDERGWISGFVNRLLPVKVAARSLLELQRTRDVTVDLLRETAAENASRLAKRLAGIEEGGVGRDETLLTGLPARDPLFRAKRRFADHFVVRSGGSSDAHGALVELGLAGLHAVGDSLIGLTAAGQEFASLPNPLLDVGSMRKPARALPALSRQEQQAYIHNVLLVVPRERRAAQVLLEALCRDAQSVPELDAIADRLLGRRFGRTGARGQKTAALGRLRDLDLVSRESTRTGVYFHATDEGRQLYRAMCDADAEQSATRVKARRARTKS